MLLTRYGRTIESCTVLLLFRNTIVLCTVQLVKVCETTTSCTVLLVVLSNTTVSGKVLLCSWSLTEVSRTMLGTADASCIVSLGSAKTVVLLFSGNMTGYSWLIGTGISSSKECPVSHLRTFPCAVPSKSNATYSKAYDHEAHMATCILARCCPTRCVSLAGGTSVCVQCL